MSSTRAIQRYHSGSLPFAVDVFLGTYEGPAWVRQKLRGKSGWMQLSRAKMETPISTWRTTLIAARTDDGESLGMMTSSAFLAMRSSGPRELDQVPPDELDVQSEMLFWDFLGRCDLRHLRMLREAEAEATERIASEQARGEQVLAEADAYIANLRRQRRGLDAADERRAGLAEAIGFFEEKQSAAARWLVQRLARVREEVMTLEAEVMAALENHGEVEELYTVRWTARHPADRIYSRERRDSFFLGPNPTRRRNLTAEARLAWDRQYDDESNEEKRSRLDLLREERRREWVSRLAERERAEAERRMRREAANREFARWEAEQLGEMKQTKRRDWRLTVEEANDLSANVKRMQQAARDKSIRTVTGAAAVPRRRLSRKPDAAIDDTARAVTEQRDQTPPKSDIDEFHDWMKDVGLV